MKGFIFMSSGILKYSSKDPNSESMRYLIGSKDNAGPKFVDGKTESMMDATKATKRKATKNVRLGNVQKMLTVSLKKTPELILKDGEFSKIIQKGGQEIIEAIHKATNSRLMCQYTEQFTRSEKKLSDLNEKLLGLLNQTPEENKERKKEIAKLYGVIESVLRKFHDESAFVNKVKVHLEKQQQIPLDEPIQQVEIAVVAVDPQPLKSTMSAELTGLIGSFLEPEEYQKVVATVQQSLGIEPTATTRRRADQERNIAHNTILQAVADIMAGKEPQINSKLKAKLLDVNHLECFMIDKESFMFKKASTEQLQKVISFLLKYCPKLHSLNLSKCESLTLDILKQLTSFTSLHTLSLSQTNITDEGVAQLASLRLTSLDLSNTEITGSTLDTLSRDIEELNLYSCNRLTDAGIANLGLKRNAQGVVIHEAMRLKKLNLSKYSAVHDTITGSTLDTLSRDIEELNLYCCKRLTDAGIANLGIKRNAQGVVIHEAMRLKTLKLNHTTITGSTLHTLFRGIQEMDFTACYGLTDAGVANLGLKRDAQGVIIHEAMQLKKLNLACVDRITGSTLDTLSRDIEELSFWQCQGLTDEGVANLGLKRNAQGVIIHEAMQLRKLNLASTSIAGSTLDTLFRGIEELNFYQCQKLTDEGLANLGLKCNAEGAIIREAMRLKKLDLTCTQITGSTLNVLSRGIVELNLSWCSQITDTGVANLGLKRDAQGTVIHPAMQLRKLHLKSTLITGSTLNTLSRGIKELDCSSHLLTDEAVAHLGLKHNAQGVVIHEAMRLRKLDLCCAKITGSTLNMLSRGIVELNLSWCSLLTDEAVANLGLKHDAQGAVIHEAMQLKKLDLSQNHTTSSTITGSTLNTLSRGIVELDLSYCGSLTDAGVANLGLKRDAQGTLIHPAMQLRKLNLSQDYTYGGTITGSTLDTLSRDIEELNLANCKNLTDAGVANLGLKRDAQGTVIHPAMQLRKLNLSQHYTHDSSITGSTLDTLSRGIEDLDLHMCNNLTDAGIANLRLKRNAQDDVIHPAMQLKKINISLTKIANSTTVAALEKEFPDLEFGYP